MQVVQPAQLKFCQFCGGGLDWVAQDKLACDKSHFTYISSIAVSAVLAPVIHAAVTHLISETRNIEPCKGEECLPGGYCKPGHTNRESAALEFFEETGILCHAADLTYVGESYALVNVDPHSRVMTLYSNTLVDFEQVDFGFKDKDNEVQKIGLVHLNESGDGLLDFNNQEIELCFTAHQQYALGFLQQAAQPKTG